MPRRRRVPSIEDLASDPAQNLPVDATLPYAEACLRQFVNRYVVARGMQRVTRDARHLALHEARALARALGQLEP